MKKNYKINVIIAAGGLSQRYGIENKLFAPCGNSCVLTEAIKPFTHFNEITKIIVALEPSYSDELLNALSVLHLDEDNRITLTAGGTSRTKTVLRGLESVDEDCDFVIIHDGARPFVTNKLIADVLAAAEKSGAAVPLLSLTDSLVSVSDGVNPVNRNDFRKVQTPVCFEKNRVLSAYNNCKDDYFDDVAVVKMFSDGEISVVDGDPDNIKITVKEDLKTPLTGCGYDIHRLEKGKGIKLNGVAIPCPYKFTAHSDGDVPVHALMDAILSACGQKDIGHLFPVDDIAYDNADSMLLLAEVVNIAAVAGYSIINAAVTVIAEEPYIAPYIDAMRNNLAKALSVTASKIGITATTNEKVGEIGNCKAIAAYATVLLA